MEYIADKFLAQLEKIQEKYKTDKNIKTFKSGLTDITRKYKNYFGLGDCLINIAEEEYYSKGDYLAGLTIIETVHKYFKNVADEMTVFLRMAEYYIENGETEKGKDYLIKLCTETASNYEEALEFRKLTAVWEKYKHFVDGKVPPSEVFCSGNPIPPEKCKMQIAEILNLSDHELLNELSTHLNEMSANGEMLNCLNKWEKTVFYIDELCCEINSGGFSNYLYYYGNHFEKAKASIEAINATEMLELLNTVELKFPRGKIPKSIESIQNNLDKLEEKEIDFDAEDNRYYNFVESELLKKTIMYINENKKHFR